MSSPSRNRNVYITSILVLFCLKAFGKTKKPHIIFIVADDLGWDDVSFHGSPQIPTPYIDHLATRGVILNNYYVSPICTPTRASIMTGKYPIHLGMQHFVIYAAQPYGLPLDEITLPQYLKTQGYRTSGVGKWHLGFFAKEYTPINRGFDSFFGFWGSKADYWNRSSYENDFWGIDMRDDMTPISSEAGTYGTALFTRKAVELIMKHDTNSPLFLYLAHQAVHSANQNEPLQAPQDKIDKFKDTIDDEDRRIYAAMVTELDQSVGDIFEALKKKNMENDSVIVFTTDNGGAPNGFNWNMGSNYPFRGGKDMVWEGGIRGTAFVYSNLISEKGRVCQELIDVSDWVPTLYYLAGGDPDLLHPNIDGKNVWKTISRGEKSPRDEILHAIDPWRNFAALRKGRYKLVVGMDDTYDDDEWHPRYTGKDLSSLDQPILLPGAVINCGKLSDKNRKCDSKNGSACLFDMVEDPCEYNDLSNEMPHVVEQLRDRLNKYRNGSRPVWYPPIDVDANPDKRNGYWGPWKELTDNSSITNGWNAISTLLVADILGGKHADQIEQRCPDQQHFDEILANVSSDLPGNTKLKDLIAYYMKFCIVKAKPSWTPNKPVKIFTSEQPMNKTDRFYYRLKG